MINKDDQKNMKFTDKQLEYIRSICIHSFMGELCVEERNGKVYCPICDQEFDMLFDKEELLDDIVNKLENFIHTMNVLAAASKFHAIHAETPTLLPLIRKLPNMYRALLRDTNPK